MGSQKIFQFILILGTALTMLGILLFFKQGALPLLGKDPHSGLITQNTNTYLGPHKKMPDNRQLVRVQVLVGDDPNPQGVQILEAQFNGQDIPLKPRDIYGFRGQASFQVLPDKYVLQWKVNRDKFVWPRSTSHEEVVTIDPRDLWVQISIVGDKATIQ